MSTDVLQIKVVSTGITQSTNDLNKLGTAAENTEKKVIKLVETVNNMAKQFAAGASGTKAMTEALAASQRTTAASDAAMKSLANSISESNKVTKGLGEAFAILSKEVGVLNGRLQQTGTAVNNSTKHIVHHTAAMSEAHSAARGLTGALGALWLTYGNIAPLAAGAAIGASLKAIVTIGVDVENTLEAIRLKTGATSEEMVVLGKTISDLGRGIYGPQEVTKALETLSLAGLNATQAATAVGAALNLATSGGTSIEKSAEALVTIGTAVRATASEYDYLGDAIQKTANISLASVDSIAETVKRASVVNQLYGASFEDILTQAAALAQLGIKNSAAGTAITNFYANARAETDKAKKALDALGFSFQDASGKVKPLVQAFTEYNAALSKFDLNSQKDLITAQFGERALRDVQAVLSLLNQAAESTERLADGTLKYKNRLEEIQEEVKNSAGTAALVAAEQALTTENRFKAVGNTLKSTFLEAFESIGPAANNVAKILKNLFSSEEFKTGLNNIVSGFGKLAEFLANNIPLITAVAEGFIAVGIASAGGALFTRMIPAVQGLAVAFGAVTVAANGAAVATGLFGTAIKALPGIGLALGLASAAYALYSLHADKATKSTKELAEEKRKLAEEYSGDFFGNLDKEIARLTEVNKQLEKGVDLTKAQSNATAEMALQKLRATNQEAIDAAQKDVDIAKKNPKLFSYIGQLEALKKLKTAQETLNNVKNKAAKDEEAALSRARKIVELTQAQSDMLKKREQAADAAAKAAAGTKTFTGKDESVEKQLSFLGQENLALRKATLGYEARTKAVIESYTSGQKVIVGAHQATVEANKLEGKYANDRIYREQLAKALAADNAKLELDRQQIYGEVSQKINDIIKAEEERQKMAKSGQVFNALRRELEAAAGYTKISEKQLEIDRARAEQAEKIRIANDNRKKIESATGNSLQRAEQFADELAIMEKYGVAVKQTAVEFAKAELAKRGFTEDSVEGQSRMGAAGVEDLNKALLDLQKTYMALQQWQEDQSQLGLESTLGVETAKVAAYQRTAEKAIEFEQAKAQAAIDAQLAAGKITEGAADVAYMQLEARINKIKGLLGEKLSINFKIAGLKDIANQFDDIADNASKLGKGFDGATRALDKFSDAFKTMAEAEKTHGKNEAKMQTARIGFYGDLADGAKHFFHENTAGYKTLDGVAKIFHAAQLARNIVEMGQMAIKAVMNQAQGDPYTAWGRMAAMAATMAALGFAVGGGFSGGSGGETAQQVQEKQGTGSIFGDSKSKSASIANSLELLEKNSDIMLPLTQGMLSALKNIEASMSGLANIVVRTNVGSGADFANFTGSSMGGGVLGKLAMSTTKLFGGLGPIGDILGGIVSGIFGKTTKSIVDSGLTFGGKVSDLQQGQGFNQYASIDTTKKSLFGLVKKTSNSVETKALNDEVSKQFGLIFTNLEVALKSAASGFGKSGTDIGNVIANTVLDTTKLSLKDLKGDELTAAINSVISKAMDDIAMNAFPGLNAFRKVGEGYAETVLRVSSGIEQASVALEQFNINAVNYTDIVNKQGDVASEIFKQSVLAVEQFDGVRDIVKNLTGDVSELAATYKELKDIQNQLSNIGLLGGNLSIDTIKGAGGLDNLQQGIQDFFDNILTEEQQLAIKTSNLAREFSLLGYSVPASKEAFAALIKSVDDGSVAGNKLVGQLLVLSQSFVEVGNATENLIKQQKEAIDNAKEAAMSEAMSQVNAAFNTLKRSVDNQKKIVKENYDFQVAFIKAAGEARKKAAQAELDTAKENLTAITGIYNSLTGALGSAKIESAALSKARRDAAVAYLNNVRGTDLTKNATGINSALSDIGNSPEQFYSSFEDFARDQAKANEAIAGLKNQAEVQKTFAELTVERLDDTIKAIEAQTQAELDAAQNQFEEEISKLDKIIESAQAQIDALNGINTSILSLASAIAGFQGAVAGALGQQAANAGNGAINPAAGIGSIYQQLLGRAPDAGGFNFYLDAYNKGISLSEIAKDIAKSPEYNSIRGSGGGYSGSSGSTTSSGLYVPSFGPTYGILNSLKSFDVGTNYIPNDMMAMVHEGERIIPKADNAELMRRLDQNNQSANYDAMCQELSEIKQAIISGDVANVQQTRELVRISKRWDQDGLPPERTA